MASFFLNKIMLGLTFLQGPLICISVMITRSQCRAARGLLGWTQQDLANAACISKTAILNFERGASDVKADTLRQIRQAFERKKLRFGDMDTVGRSEDSCRMLEGSDKLFKILEEAGKTAGDGDGEVLISYLGEQEIIQHGPESFYNITRLWEANGIKARYLLGDGGYLFLQPSAEYRWIPKELAGFGVTTIIYGTYTAIKFWHSDSYAVIDSSEIAGNERNRFESLWRTGKIPPARMTAEEITGDIRTGAVD